MEILAIGNSTFNCDGYTHAGAKIQDMFSESQQGAACSFKEPPEHGGKFRWQIIHLKEKETADKPKPTSDYDISGSQEALVPKEKSEFFNYYRKANATHVCHSFLRSTCSHSTIKINPLIEHSLVSFR